MKRRFMKLLFDNKGSRVTVILCRKPMQQGLIGM